MTLERIYDDARVEVHQVVVGPVDNNVNIIRCKRTGEGLLIDAANEHEMLLELCRRFGVTNVVETHGHWDHIQAVEQLREAGIAVAVSAEDAEMLPSYDLTIADDAAIAVGDLLLTTIATPGHTQGSICFQLQGTDLLFTGDTLFPGGPGNTFGDSAAFTQILGSIEERLFKAFSTNMMVLPGHGKATTLGQERPHFDEWVARGW
jgi:glyoxylase-like metal-dependent hydrolase (beta-lactamase superfamily II)